MSGSGFRFLEAQGLRRVAECRLTLRQIAIENGSRSDLGAATHVASKQDRRMGSQEDLFLGRDFRIERGIRRQHGMCANVAVVTDQGIGVDEGVLADDRIGAHERERCNDAARIELGRLGDVRQRMNQAEQRGAPGLDALCHDLAVAGIAQCDDHPMVGLEIEVVVCPENGSIRARRHGLGVLIEKTGDLDADSAFLDLAQIGQELLSQPARADDQNALHCVLSDNWRHSSFVVR